MRRSASRKSAAPVGESQRSRRTLGDLPADGTEMRPRGLPRTAGQRGRNSRLRCRKSVVGSQREKLAICSYADLALAARGHVAL
eukprot:1210334-Pleurochrysis_carterae.AAC.1